MVRYIRLPAICQKVFGSHIALESERSFIFRSRGVENSTHNATEFEEHTQHIMLLAHQYAFGVTNHFDPEEVMKVTEILHFERCCELGFYTAAFDQVNTSDDIIIHIEQYPYRLVPILPDEK